MTDQRRKRLAMLSVAGVMGAALAVAGSRRRGHRPGSPFMAGPPLLIAHRGGLALAPENTEIAFRRAVEWWRAEVIELDVHSTRDGEAVVIHDATLDRTTNGSGPVAERTLAEVQSLDAGHRFTPDGGATYPFRDRGIRIPTLGEALRAVPMTRIIIEIKDGRAQDRVWEAVVEAGAAHRVLIAAERKAHRVRLQGRGVPISASMEDLKLFMAQMKLGRIFHVPAVDAFQVPARWEGQEIPTRAFISSALRWNVPVHVWTVNDPGEMNEYLDRGADGLVTDRPDLLARVLHERTGRPLPPGPPMPLPEPFLEALLGS